MIGWYGHPRWEVLPIDASFSPEPDLSYVFRRVGLRTEKDEIVRITPAKD